MDKIFIVGIGDDGPAGLGARARALVSEAEFLTGGERHLAFFPDHPAQKLVVGSNLDELADRLAACLGRRRAVVLASGDPNFFGVARFLLSRLPRERLEILPALSSMQLAFARAKLNWDDAAFATTYSRPLDEVVDLVARHPKVALLTDGPGGPAAVARALLAREVGARRAFVGENLGGEGERCTETDLEALAGMSLSPLSVLILVREGSEGAPPPRTWGMGIPDDAFRQRRPKRGPITKVEVRMISLAKLNLRSDSVAWDVGAGSGSVGIEAARLAPRGRVYAIERNAKDVENIRLNAARFGAVNLVAVHGVAPAGLEGFPDPDAVFIGGTGGELAGILDAVCRRLRPGGRLVLNLITLEHLAAADGLLAARRWERETTLVSVARSRPIATSAGSLTRLEPLDPVFVLAAWRPGEGPRPEGGE